MLHPVPFRAEHLWQIDLQPAQQWFLARMRMGAMMRLEGPHSYTLMDGPRPLLCCGAGEIWHNRAFVWSFLSTDVNASNFREVTSLARQFLDGLPWRRLEAAVDDGFDQGRRWVVVLGFELETPKPARAFHVDGRDCYLYARVRN